MCPQSIFKSHLNNSPLIEPFEERGRFGLEMDSKRDFGNSTFEILSYFFSNYYING